MIVIIRKINLGRTMQLCNNTRFIVQFYKICRSSVLYVTANENYLFDQDENATIDADLTISTFVADRIDSDRMYDLGTSWPPHGKIVTLDSLVCCFSMNVMIMLYSCFFLLPNFGYLSTHY